MSRARKTRARVITALQPILIDAGIFHQPFSLALFLPC